MKILVINDIADCGASYYRPFQQWGEYETNLEILETPKEIRFVVFTGGSDVSPSFYNEDVYCRTYSDKKRDLFEKDIFDQIFKLKIPMVGICRGAQFLCVMAGGKLVQHVEGHHGNHLIETSEKRILTVNSLHHQMQMPPEDAEILAWASPSKSKVYYGIKHIPDCEPECVWYPKINALGIQYHPEIMSPESEGFQYCTELVEKYIVK